jgi:dephospho-CoA kinase
LLFETAAENEFDAVICLACSAEIQKARLLGRGWDEAQIAGRIGTQLPIEEKIDRSDFVVWNESGLDELGEQLERILQELGIAPD